MRTTRVSRTVGLAALAVVSLAGCAAGGGGGGTSKPAVDTTNLTESTPAGTTAVEHVRWGLSGGEPTTVDPAQAGSDSAYYVVANLCETLLLTTPSFGIEANLATSVEWSDPTTLVIDLRDDVTFWDGAPLTPEDVIFSLQRAADPATGSVNTSAFSRVADMTKTGDHQVTITLVEPFAEFRNALAGPAGYIVQQKFTEAAGADIGTPSGGVMCTGAYELDAWTAGTSITTTANEDHWRKTPLVSELEYVFVGTDTTLASALLSGELDGAFTPPVASLAQFQNSDQGTLYLGPSTAFASFGPATPDGPAGDARVRTALDLAIDKQAAIDTAMNGLGTPVRTFVPPFLWEGTDEAAIFRAGYDALPDNTIVDLDEAKALIAEAGAEGAELVIGITAGEQQSLSLATIVQAAGKEIGLSFEIKQLQPTEFAKIFYDPAGRDGLDFVLTVGYSDTPAILAYPSFFVIPDGLFNWGEFENPEVTRLMAQAETAIDPVAKAESFVAAQALYVPERLMIMFGSEYARTFISDDLTGVVTSFSHITSPWAIDLGGK